jgi:hypothetical protein
VHRSRLIVLLSPTVSVSVFPHAVWLFLDDRCIILPSLDFNLDVSAYDIGVVIGMIPVYRAVADMGYHYHPLAAILDKFGISAEFAARDIARVWFKPSMP